MKTILVAEDRQASRELLDAILRASGYLVVMAEDGEEALLRASEQTFDLVILDLRMPHLDGYGTLLRLRATETYRDIPIMALTASAMPEDKNKAIAAGFSEFITKPVNPGVLRQRIARLLAGAE